MKIYLADNKKITKYQLPSKIDDTFLINYLIQDTEYSIVFKMKNDVLHLESTGSVNVIVEGQVKEFVKIDFYKRYSLKLVGLPYLVDAYFMPNMESLFKVSFAETQSINIGNNSTCHVQYAVPTVSGVQAVIKYTNNDWYISCLNDDNYKTYINNHRGIFQKLKIGDIIFIDGLRIVWMGDFMCLNNPQKMLKIAVLSLINENYEHPDNILEVSEDDKFAELYSKEEYFYHYPKISEKLVNKEVSIDSPPGSYVGEKVPWLISFGPSLVMVASVFVMLYNIITGFINKVPISNLVPQMVMCFSMLVGSFIMPKVVNGYQNKQAKKKEALRQEKYSAYLDSKEKEIINYLNDEHRILNDNYLDINRCLMALRNKDKNFWSRRCEDDDFLELRLGSGFTKPHFVIKAPEESFSIDSDNLLQKVYDIKKKYNQVANAPITISVKEHNVVSIICVKDLLERYIDYLITQITILHSSMDVKLVIVTNEGNANRWEFAKYLPHIFSDDKTMRFFATNEDEAKVVSGYLEDIMKERNVPTSDGTAKNKVPYYLVITDDYKNYKHIKIIDDITSNRLSNLGVSLIVVENTIKQVPINCEVFVEVGEKEGVLIAKQQGLNEQQIFDIQDAVREINMFQISNLLANIPVVTKDGPSVLPTSLSFLEMFKVSRIEQLNILNRWQTSNPVVSLSTIIGVRTSGDKFKLDLHEKFHGPHGLIAGMTGSGKSEFIITFILSMAINYHPYEVQFVLIDYKGGGLAGAFENNEAGIKIPHLVGTITNLDVSEMNRSLVSIQSELVRRQRIFNETREKLNEGTIDIYKYQKLYREGVVKKPMSHLFIICDEFAELKQQQPDFMQSLISISRIGRSLGIHLILATQKPSGLVNDQIWANSKFKICLKVQEKADSMEMLKRPEAASIKETGRFYLQVGYNDFFDIGQSGWSGAKYIPSDKILIKSDESLNFINNVGYQTKNIKDIVEDKTLEVNHGEQLINIVRYLDQIGKRENIYTGQLWLDAIPEIINISELKTKYNYKPESYYINPVIGEFDDPVNQVQGILNVDLSRRGNLLIYGASGSGKENLLTTLIRSTIVEHTPDEVNIYILDCGAESLKIFNSMPHVGDVITIDEADKIFDLFELANNELEIRKDLFADYAGSYNDFIQNSGRKLPLKLFVINNYDSFSENYGDLTDKIQFLFRDGAKYGVVFIVTAINTNALRSRAVQSFDTKICLKMANSDGYRDVFNIPRMNLPDKFGRGFIGNEFGVFEFQTASFAPKKDITNSLRELSKILNESYTTRAKGIPYIPEVVSLSELVNRVDSDTSLPIGYGFKSKDVCYYDFAKNHILPIVAMNIDKNKMSFVMSIMKLLNYRLNNVKVIDFANAYTDPIEGIECINDDYDSEFVNVYNEIVKSKETGTQNYYVILGTSFLAKKLNEKTYELITGIFSKINEFPNTYFILVDVYNGFKNVVVENWYGTGEYNKNAIWLGEGFGSQSVFESQPLSSEEKRLDVPYLGISIVNGKAEFIKHVVDMELKDEQ